MAARTVRPADEPEGTCDWGGCDEDADGWRWDDVHGWLPVCESHENGPDDEAISLAWEAATGADSISTIERIYDKRPSGAYVCIWPECDYARKDSAAIWRHVHTAHGSRGLPPGDFDYGRWL